MKKRIPLLLLTSLFVLSGCGATDNNEEKVHLIILAGQSGARGKALNSDLTDKYENYDVEIVQDGLMMPDLNRIPQVIDEVEIEMLQKGFGDTREEFGPELGIGETLASRYPMGDDIHRSIIVKYTACGSTFTDHWYSKSMLEDDNISSKLNVKDMRENPKTGENLGPLTNNLYQMIDNTIDMLKEEGFEAVVDGAIFIHGEQDAKETANMDIYEDALKYFISDLREHVGDNDMPFVVTEALTNSAKYSNKLRDIQHKVVSEINNTSLVKTMDLYTNTFESWHFGAKSNMVLGNRASAELISYNDKREIVRFRGVDIDVPLGADIELPQYVTAEFDNGYEGLVKVEYTSSYDKNKLGSQQVNFKANGFNGYINVNVTNNPYVDGIANEYDSYKKNTITGLGDIYVKKGEKGLYVGANISDKDIWTDGEDWHNNDMGQDKNDDFRVYLTTNDVSKRTTLCLSASNLFRVYANGTSLNDTSLASKNLVYRKQIEKYEHHVTGNGLFNSDNQSDGLSLEMYISYEDLNITNPDDIKMCFNYRNISMKNGTRGAENNYCLAKSSSSSNPEEDIQSYFSINDLI